MPGPRADGMIQISSPVVFLQSRALRSSLLRKKRIRGTNLSQSSNTVRVGHWNPWLRPRPARHGFEKNAADCERRG